MMNYRRIAEYIVLGGMALYLLTGCGGGSGGSTSSSTPQPQPTMSAQSLEDKCRFSSSPAAKLGCVLRGIYDESTK